MKAYLDHRFRLGDIVKMKRAACRFADGCIAFPQQERSLYDCLILSVLEMGDSVNSVIVIIIADGTKVI